jgi:hypothetical protein
MQYENDKSEHLNLKENLKCQIVIDKNVNDRNKGCTCIGTLDAVSTNRTDSIYFSSAAQGVKVSKLW